MDNNKKWTSIRQTFEQKPLCENSPRRHTNTAYQQQKSKECFKSKDIFDFLYGNQLNNNSYNIKDDKNGEENSKILVSPLQKRRKILPLSIGIDKRPNSRGPFIADANEESIKNYDPDYAQGFDESNCNKQLPTSLVFYKNTTPKPTVQAQSKIAQIVSPCSCPWPDLDYKKEKRLLEDSISEFDSDENSPIEKSKNSQKFKQMANISHSSRHLTELSKNIKSNRTPERLTFNQTSLPCISNLHSEKEKRQRKPRKGGLAEKLVKSLDRAKSNCAFWQHERNIDLIPPSSIARVISIECTYSSILIYLNVNNKGIVVFLNSESKIAKKIYPGIDIEIDLTGPNYKLNNTIVYPYVDKILIHC